MATGDQNDMARRLAAVLPKRWFPDPSSAPVLNAVLQGFGFSLAWIFSLIAFTRAQARLSTSSGTMIDLWAQGWFGSGNFPRHTGETDAAYIARIKANLFVLRGTRPVFISLMTAATGAAPKILEPMNPSDTGGYGSRATPAAGGGGGYDQGGIYLGSLLYPAQFFAQQPRGTSGLPDGQIYAAETAALPVGVTAWTELE